MDYAAIDRFMQRTGLAKEPAFDFLHFLNEPIPPMEKKRILGLYFPEGEVAQNEYGYLPPSTIILPPDADKSTLLHELGHRYGHYYFNDLSESFAENYRKAREAELLGSPRFATRMAPVAQETEWQLIGSGTKNNINDAATLEDQVDEGQNARLDCVFATSVPSFQIDALRNSLIVAGVTNLQVVSSGSTVSVYYTKGQWWIPVIIIAVLAIGILLISWAFFREVVKTTGPAGATIFIIGGALLAGALVYGLVSSRRRVT